MEEYFDTYDTNGNYLGVQPKSYCHSPQATCYHKPVWIWIYNDKGQLLVQKRSPMKKKSPNKWDIPSAGHVQAGENLLDACVRETEEELGVKTKQTDFKFLKEWINGGGWNLFKVTFSNLMLK